MKNLEKKLGVEFKDKNLLEQAFVHRSYLNENPGLKMKHNERLEFLGDAVLELAVTDYLFNNYPNPEGELTIWRASLVNSKILAEIADSLGFNDFLLLSKGEHSDTGRARQFILANTLEAVVGAIVGATHHEPDFIVGKPNTYMLELVCKEHGLSAKDICVVGDVPESDIKMADNFGCQSILFDPENVFQGFRNRISKLPELLSVLN